MKGIDVSNNLGNIDFNAVKNSGVEVVYIKATEGKSYKDPYLMQNYQRAKQAGLKIGFYHYSWNHGAEAARWFYNAIKYLNYDCKLALDIEQTNNLSKTTISQKCIEFLEELERLTGKQPLIYTYTSFARENLDSRLAKYPVWIAEYQVSNPHSNPVWGNSWVGFQYSESGNVTGINGGCDLNSFKEDVLLDEKQGYVITNYLPNGYHGDKTFQGIDAEYVLQYFKGVRCYFRSNSKGIWIETQYLLMSKCQELKGILGSWFYQIKEK